MFQCLSLNWVCYQKFRSLLKEIARHSFKWPSTYIVSCRIHKSTLKSFVWSKTKEISMYLSLKNGLFSIVAYLKSLFWLAHLSYRNNGVNCQNYTIVKTISSTLVIRWVYCELVTFIFKWAVTWNYENIFIFSSVK